MNERRKIKEDRKEKKNLMVQTEIGCQAKAEEIEFYCYVNVYSIVQMQFTAKCYEHKREIQD